MASEYAPASVQALAPSLEEVDPVRELLDERGGVKELVGEVARVEVDTEALAVADRREPCGWSRSRRRSPWVHPEAHLTPSSSKTSMIGFHLLGEVLVAALYLREVVGRE